MPDTINNNAADLFLNKAAAQAKGETKIAEQDYTDLIHEAGDWTVGQKEQFLGQLSAQYADTMYTDAAWSDKYGDLFFKNSDEFGAIVQIINTEMPEVRENRAWDQIVSGYTTIGSNVVYLPVVKEQLTGGTSSWAVPYALTGTQLQAAFRDAAGLRRFESYVVMAAENAGRYHIARMTAANRNNYMLEKLAKGNTAYSTGVQPKINVVNYVEEYCRMRGITTGMTAQEFLNNTNGCLRSVQRTTKKYQALVTDMTTLFSMQTDTKGKFIPPGRFTFSVIADFVGLLESELYSTTWHNDFVKLSGYREIPSWQGLVNYTEDMPEGYANYRSTASLLDLCTITAKQEGSVIDSRGVAFDSRYPYDDHTHPMYVVGLMCDSWAIINTIVRHRTGVQRDDIKDITLFEHQYTDRYINNLMLPGIVFVIADVPAANEAKKAKK